MIENLTDDRLRDYAAGNLAWRELDDAGADYREVLAGLGRLGLRPPIVRDNGPNAAALAKGQTTVRMLIERRRAGERPRP